LWSAVFLLSHFGGIFLSDWLLLVGILVFVIALVLLIRLYFKFRRADETEKQVLQGQFFVCIGGTIFLAMSLLETVTNDGHPWLKLALGVSCLLDGIRRIRATKKQST
jgi:hypothetical protein